MRSHPWQIGHFLGAEPAGERNGLPLRHPNWPEVQVHTNMEAEFHPSESDIQSFSIGRPINVVNNPWEWRMAILPNAANIE